MRFAFIILVALLSASCQEATRPTITYDSMAFVRGGGGDLAFALSLSADGNVGHVNVTHYEYDPVSITFDLVKDGTNPAAFESLEEALAGRIWIKGFFHRTTLPTGTWASVYVVRGSERVEVTNTELRDQLLTFERLVRAKL